MKHKALILLLLLVPVAFFIISCDDRGGDKPTLEIHLSNPHLYAEGGSCNLDFTDITFFASGSQGYIENAKVLVEYDATKGLFFILPGSGSTGGANHIELNENGVGTARFKAQEGAFGVMNFVARMDRFRNVEDNVVIYMYDLPEIAEMYAMHESITPNGSTEVFVKISDEAGNIGGKRINFSVNRGLLDPTSALTNSNGLASTLVAIGDGSENIIVKATLAICPNISRELTIEVID